jgi:alkylation response protein AidB-like acyl-CoA dehydrogenase
VGSIRCRAQRYGDTYVIDDDEVWITNAPVPDLITNFAVTDPEKGPAGISAFIVEKAFPRRPRRQALIT